MADTTLRLRYPTGSNLYTQIEGGDGIWNGSAYVAFANTDWASFATATPETPAGSGRYVCQFPTSSDPGNYSWSVYLRAGGTPTISDVAIGQGGGYWDGTTFGGASMVTGDVGGNVAGSVDSVVNGVAAVLPTVPPLGYGPIGTGSVAVNQDYPTAGNLAFRISPTGPGIAGALVKAYLASEYAFNPNTAPIRGQTITLDSGAWSNNINLDPADYVIVFSAYGYEDTFVDLTVS